MNRRKATKRPPRTSPLCTVIEPLENRAMLAGLGQDSLSGLGSITAVLLPGVSSPPGIVLTGGSPTLGSTAGAGGSQSTGPVLFCGSGSGTGSSSSGSSSSAPNGPVLLGGSGSGTGSSSSGSSSSDPNGPVLLSQYTGGSNAGTQGSGTNNGGTLSGSDLWLLYGAGLGAGSSSSGASGGSSSNLLTLLSQYQEGSTVGGQGNGTGNTLSNADLWNMYWSGTGAGSSSGSDNGSLANDPAISAQYTGGSGIGGITPLVYNPESDGPPVFHSGVFTGDHGSVQFVQTADTGNEGTGEGDEPKDESEPPAKSWWGWFIGDDPIKGSLWKQGPSRISRAGDRPTHNDDKSAVESLEDCGKYTKEIIDGAKLDGALAGAGAVIGKLGAKSTARPPLWTSTNSRTNVQNAFDHFKKHGAEFPECPNAMQYAKRAWEFVTNPPVGTLTKLRPNGDVLFYNPATNTFAVRTADGSLRTMFRPTNGINYWNLQ